MRHEKDTPTSQKNSMWDHTARKSATALIEIRLRGCRKATESPINTVGEKIVAEARTWIGTKWGHQKMTKGVQCDCAGLVRGTMEAVTGIRYDDLWDYGHRPHAPTLIGILNKYFTRIPVEEAGPGDVMLFKIGNNPQHLAIRTDKGIIHAYAAGPRKVEEVSFADPWPKRLVGVWRVPDMDSPASQKNSMQDHPARKESPIVRAGREVV